MFLKKSIKAEFKVDEMLKWFLTLALILGAILFLKSLLIKIIP